jgi:hypothetical protein
MTENGEFIRITAYDISEANQLSLHCPICAGAVEQHAPRPELVAVYCDACETLYHRACWEQNGASCAVLGCSGDSYRVYGAIELGPVLTVRRTDIPRVAPAPSAIQNGRNRRLKEDERRMQRELRRRSLLRDLWYGLLRAIKLWPSDPS